MKTLPLFLCVHKVTFFKNLLVCCLFSHMKTRFSHRILWFSHYHPKNWSVHIYLWCERSMCNSTGCGLVFFSQLCVVWERVCFSSANPSSSSVFVIKNKQMFCCVAHHYALRLLHCPWWDFPLNECISVTDPHCSVSQSSCAQLFLQSLPDKELCSH